MPDPCDKFQEHAWKKDVCVNCLKSRAQHGSGSGPVAAKRHSKNLDSSATKSARKPEIKSSKPDLIGMSTKQREKEKVNASPKKEEEKSSDDLKKLTDDEVKDSIAKLMAKQSPTPKHERLQRATSSSGASVYSRGFPDLTKLKSNPSSPVKSFSSPGTTRSPSLDSSTSTTSTMSTASVSDKSVNGVKKPDISQDAKKGSVNEKIDKAKEKRAEKLKGSVQKGTKRPHAPPPVAPPPAPPAADGGKTGKGKGAKSGGSHYYHQYDLSAKGKSGTPQSTLEKAKKLKDRKKRDETQPEDVHVAMPYTVVDVSKCVPKEKAESPPKLPVTPAPDRTDSLHSNASHKRLSTFEKNGSRIENNGSQTESSTKKIEDVLPGADKFNFIDGNRSEPVLPVILHEEQAQMKNEKESPTPARKVPIMIKPNKIQICHTYEPIGGEDEADINGSEPFQRQSPSRSSDNKSVSFNEESRDISSNTKKPEKAKKSGKSFFRKLLKLGTKDSANESNDNGLDNSIDDDFHSSQDNLDSDTNQVVSNSKRKPSSEKSVSFGFNSEWAEAINRETPESPSSPVSTTPTEGDTHIAEEAPLSPKLSINLSPETKRQQGLSKELEIDTSFIDKVMKDAKGAKSLSPIATSPPGPVSPRGPVSPGGRAQKPVKHPGVPPPPAPKLNSEKPISSQPNKPVQKRVSINVNDLKSEDRKCSILEVAEKPSPKTINLEIDHSKGTLRDGMEEEPTYEIGNLKDELSSLLEGFGMDMLADKSKMSESMMQGKKTEPSAAMTDSLISTVSSSSATSAGNSTLQRKKSRSKTDGQKPVVRRMSAAPPPPPTTDGVKRSSHSSEGSSSQPSSPQHEGPSSPSPFTRKGIEISSPIPGSQVFTHCTLPRKHKPVRALSSPDERKLSVDDWVCTRNRRMNAADKHARNKTVTEGVDLQAIQQWSSNIGTRTQSDDRFAELFEQRTHRFLNRALPPTPKLGGDTGVEITEEIGNETDSTTENVYELVHADKLSVSGSGHSGRAMYEDIDENDIYSDPLDACQRAERATTEYSSSLLPRSLSNDYLEPVSHDSGDLQGKSGTCKVLKPTVKEQPKAVNFTRKDSMESEPANVPRRSTFSTRKSAVNPHGSGQQMATGLIGSQYVDVYANTEVMLNRERLPLTYADGFNKMAIMNIESLQKLADSIYFRFIPKDPHYVHDLKWKDFQLRNTDIELIQGMYGYYKVRCGKLRPHDCFILVCASSIKLGLLDFCHANVLSPFAIFTDHLSADYFPESIKLPHAYQLYGLEQTNIACFGFSSVISFLEYWDAKYCEMSSFTPIAYERMVCNHLAQILNGLLHIRDENCIIRRLEVEYLMVVTSGNGDEEYPVINPCQWDFDNMLDIDPEPLCLDMVAILLTMLRVDASSSPAKNILTQIPLRTKYSKGFHKMLSLLAANSWACLILARNLMEFLLWGPEEEECRALMRADNREQAFNVWLEVARSRVIAQFAVQRPPPVLEVGNKLRALCALTGSALSDSAKILQF